MNYEYGATWRPDNWENPWTEFFKTYPSSSPTTGEWDLESIYETGADAILKAFIDWLFSPCTKHRKRKDGTDNPAFSYYLQAVKHKYQCPECMAKLKGEYDEIRF